MHAHREGTNQAVVVYPFFLIRVHLRLFAARLRKQSKMKLMFS